MSSNPFTCRQRGEPKAYWLEQDAPPKLSKREHELFAESCARIDARNKALGDIAVIPRRTREELACDNAKAEGGAI